MSRQSFWPRTRTIRTKKKKKKNRSRCSIINRSELLSNSLQTDRLSSLQSSPQTSRTLQGPVTVLQSPLLQDPQENQLLLLLRKKQRTNSILLLLLLLLLFFKLLLPLLLLSLPQQLKVSPRVPSKGQEQERRIQCCPKSDSLQLLQAEWLFLPLVLSLLQELPTTHQPLNKDLLSHPDKARTMPPLRKKRPPRLLFLLQNRLLLLHLQLQLKALQETARRHPPQAQGRGRVLTDQSPRAKSQPRTSQVQQILHNSQPLQQHLLLPRLLFPPKTPPRSRGRTPCPRLHQPQF